MIRKGNGLARCRVVTTLIHPIILFFLLFCLDSCNKPASGTTPGIISVVAIDNDPGETPVPDVEITLTPGDIVMKTDTSGVASFEVAPGDYFIDADLCCIGPGYIHYHESVTVESGKTSEVKLQACLRCV